MQHPHTSRLLALFLLFFCSSVRAGELSMPELIAHVRDVSTLSRESSSIPDLNSKKTEIESVIAAETKVSNKATLQSLVGMIDKRITELTEAAKAAEEKAAADALAAKEAAAAKERNSFPFTLTLPETSTQSWFTTITVNTTKDIILTLSDGSGTTAAIINVTTGGSNVSPAVIAANGERYAFYNNKWETTSAAPANTARFLSDNAKLINGETSYWFAFHNGLLAGGRGTEPAKETIGFVWKIKGAVPTIATAQISTTHPSLVAKAPPTISALPADSGTLLTKQLGDLLIPKADTTSDEKLIMQDLRKALAVSTDTSIPEMYSIPATGNQELSLPAGAEDSWIATLTSEDLKGLQVDVELNDSSTAKMEIGLSNNFISRLTAPAPFVPNGADTGYIFSRDKNRGFMYNYWRKETTNTSLTPPNSLTWHGGPLTSNAPALLATRGKASKWIAFSKGLLAFGEGDTPSETTIGMIWRVGAANSNVIKATITNTATTQTTLSALKTEAGPETLHALLENSLDTKIIPQASQTGDDSMTDPDKRRSLSLDEKKITKALREAIGLGISDDFIVAEKVITLPVTTTTTTFPYADLKLALPASGSAQWAYAFKLKGNEKKGSYASEDDFKGDITLIAADGTTAATITIDNLTTTVSFPSAAAQKYAFTRSHSGEWTSVASTETTDSVTFKGTFAAIKGNGGNDNPIEHYLIFADGLLALRQGTQVVFSWRLSDTALNIKEIKMTSAEKQCWVKDPRIIGSDIVATQIAALTEQADANKKAIDDLRPVVLAAGSSTVIRHTVEKGSGMFLFNADATKELKLQVFGIDDTNTEKVIATMIVGAKSNTESTLNLLSQHGGNKNIIHDGSSWKKPVANSGPLHTITWQNQTTPLKSGMQPYWFSAYPDRVIIANNRKKSGTENIRTTIGFGYGAAPDKTLGEGESSSLGVAWLAHFEPKYTITGFGIVAGSADVTISQARARRRLKGAGEVTVAGTLAKKQAEIIAAFYKDIHKDRVNALLADAAVTTEALTAERANLWTIYHKEANSTGQREALALIGLVETKIIERWKAGNPTLVTINAAYTAREKLETDASEFAVKQYHKNIRTKHIEPLRQQALSAAVEQEKKDLAEKFESQTTAEFSKTFEALRASYTGMPLGDARTARNDLIVLYAKKLYEKKSTELRAQRAERQKERDAERTQLTEWLKTSSAKETEQKYFELKKAHVEHDTKMKEQTAAGDEHGAADARQYVFHYQSLVGVVQSAIQKKRFALAVTHRDTAYKNSDVDSALAALEEQKAAVPTGDGDFVDLKSMYDALRKEYDTYIASRQQRANEMTTIRRGKEVSDVASLLLRTEKSGELADKIATVKALITKASDEEKTHQEKLLKTLQDEVAKRLTKEKNEEERKARIAEAERVKNEHAAEADKRRTEEKSTIDTLIKDATTTSTIIKNELLKVEARLTATSDTTEQAHLTELNKTLNAALSEITAQENDAAKKAQDATADRHKQEFKDLEIFVTKEDTTLEQLEEKNKELRDAISKETLAGNSAEAFHKQQLSGYVFTAIRKKKKALADDSNSEEKEKKRLASQAIADEIILKTKENNTSEELKEAVNKILLEKRSTLDLDPMISLATMNTYDIALSARHKAESVALAREKMREKAAKEAEASRLKALDEQQKEKEAQQKERQKSLDDLLDWVAGKTSTELKEKQKTVPSSDVEMSAILTAALATKEAQESQKKAEDEIKRATDEKTKKEAEVKAAHAAALAAQAEMKEAEGKALAFEKEKEAAGVLHTQTIESTKKLIAAKTATEIATVEANAARTIAAKETIIATLLKKKAEIEAKKQSRSMVITRSVKREDFGSPSGLKRSAENTVKLSRTASLTKSTAPSRRSRVKDDEGTSSQRKKRRDRRRK